MTYDYVIVGGGSAGCVMAARLSEDPAISVCLLEAGGDGRDLLIRVPAGLVAMVPGRPVRINNWAYETVPQPGLNGRRGFQPRGRALGGSSVLNTMLYIRGHRSDYDEWASLGCDSWSFDEVLPYFKRAERNQRGESALHGGSGPLQVGEQRDPRPISQAFLDAAAQCGVAATDDFNGAEQDGAGHFQVTQFWDGPKKGERCSAAAAYLHPAMQRPNLSVLTRARAMGIVFEGKRAVGVRYRRRGRDHRVTARREVILSGGAFNSPQLLLLSGVGPADELAAHNIPVLHELPGVGKNLQDHIDFTINWWSKPTSLFAITPSAAPMLAGETMRWMRDGSGMLATPYAETGAFIRSVPGLDRPDLQLHFVIALVEDHGRKLHFGYGYSCHVAVLRPFSRGEVGLFDADPLKPPRIDPRFLSDERDAQLLLKGTRKLREILHAPALAPYRSHELFAVEVEDDTHLMQHIRSRADTVYHPAGTCRMGMDDRAVVDPQLRVRGLEGLRVADISIMPTLIGGNTNAPAMMIGEKAADMIKGGTSPHPPRRPSESPAGHPV